MLLTFKLDGVAFNDGFCVGYGWYAGGWYAGGWYAGG